MRNRILILVISLVICTYSFSQNIEKRDSVLQVAKTASDDTTYIKAISDYAFSFKNENPDTSILLSQQILKKCKAIISSTDNKIYLDRLYQIELSIVSNLFIYLRYNNKLSEAIDLFKETKEALSKTGNSISKGNLYSNYANILVITDDVQGAYEIYMEARKINEAINNKTGIASTYYSIAKMFYSNHEYNRAIINAENALDILRETNSVRHTAYCFNLLASCYSQMATGSLDNVEKDSLYLLSSKYYELSLKIKKEYNDIHGILITLNNLSEVSILNDRVPDALLYLEEAEELAKKYNNLNLIAFSYIHYARAYIKTKEIDKALYYAQKAYELAKAEKNIDYLTNATETLSNVYNDKNDYQNAFKYFQIYTKLKDSLLKQKHVQALITNEQSFKYKRKSIEDSLKLIQQTKVYSLELEKKKTWRNWLVTIIISLILLSFFIYKNFVNQSKARKTLSSKNSHIQKQNLILKEQKSELKDMNSSLKEAYKDKVDSIKYARRIQATTFPSDESVKNSLPKSFIIYKPLDIVSGDFYWVREIKDEIIIAVGDSTGHGVPGAFLSIMGIAILKEMVNQRSEMNAAEIMGDIRNRIIETLRQYSTDDSAQHYGMDLGIVIYNKAKKTIQFSGAYTPLYIFRNPKNIPENTESMIQIKADRMPISMYPKMEPYTNHYQELEDGDMFYLFTDGTIDQFGGNEGKKLGAKIFTDKLQKNSLLPVDEQKESLEKFLNEWKVYINNDTGEHYMQTDDITILGVQI